MAPLPLADHPVSERWPAGAARRHAAPDRSRRPSFQRGVSGVYCYMSIDLRSDTVTKPTSAMRRAMAEADVGDDVYGEDPTVNMGNTIGVKVHTQHGQEVICEARAHVLNYELAMMAWFSGCVARPIYADGGILSWRQIKSEIRALGPHWAPTGLIEIENTHNMGGGTVYPLDTIREI